MCGLYIVRFKTVLFNIPTVKECCSTCFSHCLLLKYACIQHLSSNAWSLEITRLGDTKVCAASVVATSNPVWNAGYLCQLFSWLIIKHDKRFLLGGSN